MKQYCHYTDDEGAEKIIRSGTIQASLRSNGDAALGNGVYLTTLTPGSGTRAQVAQNNWGSMDDETMKKTKNVFVLEIPDKDVRNVSTTTRNIYLLGGYKDLYLHKYKWYLQDDKGKILASYRYHIESTGPATVNLPLVLPPSTGPFNIPLHEIGQFRQDYVMKDKIVNGRPVYKLKTDRFNRAMVRIFGRGTPEHHVKYLFMSSYGNWVVGDGEDLGLKGGWLRQKGNYSLGPCAAGAWEYWDRAFGGWREIGGWRMERDLTLKSYPWYANSEWKTANKPATPAATTAVTTVTTTTASTNSKPAITASSLVTTAATTASTTASSPLPPPLVKPPPLSPTHLPPAPLNPPSPTHLNPLSPTHLNPLFPSLLNPLSPTHLNPPSPDMMKRSMSASLPAQSSQDGLGLHSQDQSARMISPISQIPPGGIPQDSAPGTPGGSNYNASEGASPQYSTPVASTPVIAPSVSTQAVKPVEEKSGGQTIKQITLKSHHPSLKERQSGIIAALYGAQKDNARKAQSRGWYIEKVDWIVCDEIEDEDADLTEEQLQEGEFEEEDGEKHVSSTSMDKTLVCDGEGEGASTTQHRKVDNSPDGAVGLPVSSQLGDLATEIRDEVMQLLRLCKVTKALTLNK